MRLLEVLVAGAWLVLGAGFVPVAVYLALGVLLWLPLPDVSRHMLRLAGRAASPLGTRVVDRRGRGVLRLVPLIGATVVVAKVQEKLDPDRLLETEPGPIDLRRTRSSELLEAVLLVAWLLTFGWQLALVHLVVGLVLCLTLVGAVFGVRHLALIPVALYPAGFHVLRGEEALPPAPRFVLRGGEWSGRARWPASSAAPNRRPDKASPAD